MLSSDDDPSLNGRQTLLVRDLGKQAYEPVFAAMKDFTNTRDNSHSDELWWVEHEPVFTQGQAGKEEHLLMPGDIPVVQVDRGGQVTYHGPGQLVAYPMINIKRLGIGVRQLVTALENTMIETLALYNIKAYARSDAPGVYVAAKTSQQGANQGLVADENTKHEKIGSLGIRIRRGCAYHGLSLNVDMDLNPFLRINPCGYQGLQMTQMKTLITGKLPSMAQLQQHMTDELAKQLHYSRCETAAKPTDILNAE